jgi:hypothetical protein
MIKIRYAELPAGLHVTAEGDRRGTVVYLLPGLTPAQRRAALRRIRSSARMGQGPTLPAPAMAAAIAADRARTTARTCAAAMRGHPVLFLPPLIAVVVSAIVFMLMLQVPLTVTLQDRAAASLPTLPVGSSTSVNHRPHHHHLVGSTARQPGVPAQQWRPPASAPSPDPSPSPDSRSRHRHRRHAPHHPTAVRATSLVPVARV